MNSVRPLKHDRSRARRPAGHAFLGPFLALAAGGAALMLLASGCSSGAGPLSLSRPGPQGSSGFPSGVVTPTGGTGKASYSPVKPAQETTGTGNRSGVSGGALFGGTGSLASETGKLGRKLAIVRTYYQIGEHFPTRRDADLMAQGSTLLVSLDTVSGGASYSSIAAGHEDAFITGFVKAVNQAAVRYHLAAIYLSFEHEMNDPQTHQGLGTPGQFIQAWDHIHSLAMSAHLDWNSGGRIHWVFIMTHEGYVPMMSRAKWAQTRLASPTAFWPGDSEVDIVAADGYNSDGCKLHGDSVTPESLFDPLVSFAHANGGLPVFIAEWGSTPRDPGGGQAKFIGQMESFVGQNHEISAVMYWNSPGKRCTFAIDNYPSAITAMAGMGHSSALQGHLS
jgi:hypothetical protein